MLRDVRIQSLLERGWGVRGDGPLGLAGFASETRRDHLRRPSLVSIRERGDGRVMAYRNLRIRSPVRIETAEPDPSSRS